MVFIILGIIKFHIRGLFEIFKELNFLWKLAKIYTGSVNDTRELDTWNIVDILPWFLSFLVIDFYHVPNKKYIEMLQ